MTRDLISKSNKNSILHHLYFELYFYGRGSNKNYCIKFFCNSYDHSLRSGTIQPQYFKKKLRTARLNLNFIGFYKDCRANQCNKEQEEIRKVALVPCSIVQSLQIILKATMVTIRVRVENFFQLTQQI